MKLKENSLFAVLLRSPWWVSIGIAAGLGIATRMFIPEFYAYFVGLPFFVIGVMAAWRQLRTPGERRIAEGLAAARAMSWSEFRDALEECFRRGGYEVTRLDAGQADLVVTRAGRVSLVGCKRWKAARTGLEPLRELDAARRAREAHESIFVATGEISDNARKFAAQHRIRLVEGAELAGLLLRRVKP